MFHRKTKMEAVNGRVEILRKFVSYLETYRGRDKTIRLLTYGSYIVSGLSKRIRGGDRDFNVGKLAAELSNLRVMLRLFDDLSMLQYSLSYGIGSIHERDWICRNLQIMQNCFDQLYYPLEHLAWARDNGILKGDSTFLWSLGCLFWVISLSIGLLISLRKLMLLRKECKRNRKKFQNKTDEQTYNEQKRKQVNLVIGMFGTLADLLNGIHWLPKGILWASKLPEEVVGLSGVISSLCLIYNSVTN